MYLVSVLAYKVIIRLDKYKLSRHITNLSVIRTKLIRKTGSKTSKLIKDSTLTYILMSICCNIYASVSINMDKINNFKLSK